MSVTDFPASPYMSVDQALALASREAANGEYTEVIVLASNQDGRLIIRSSRMQPRDALWLAKMLERHALEQAGDC